MSRLHRVGSDDRREYAFHCPGCKCAHVVPVTGQHPVWTWNQSLNEPTFMPSILLRYSFWDDQKKCTVQTVCHSWVADGQIQYLFDSTHDLAGQKVPIPDWNER